MPIAGGPTSFKIFISAIHQGTAALSTFSTRDGAGRVGRVGAAQHSRWFSSPSLSLLLKPIAIHSYKGDFLVRTYFLVEDQLLQFVLGHEQELTLNGWMGMEKRASAECEQAN
jgi:hypothetical protein